MTTIKKFIIPVVAVVALVFAIIPYFRSSGGLVGGVAMNNQYIEQYDSAIRYNGGYNSQLPIKTSGSLTATGGTVIGSTGTTLNNVTTGTCYMAPSGTTIAASSTGTVDCQATAAVSKSGESALIGVQSGDHVVVTLSTTTASNTYLGLTVIGATASSTNGYITLLLSNETGQAYTWPTTGTASGTASFITTR